jgi:pyruvate kinase
MLSAETSAGRYPVEAVRMMARIAEETDAAIAEHGYVEPRREGAPTAADIVADLSYHAACEANAAAVVVFTASGSSARLVSRYRPPVCIYAMTPRESVERKLRVNYGVTPVLAPDVGSTDEMLAQMDRLMVERGYLKRGSTVVFVAGQPVGHPGTTNLMKLHRIGDS